MTETCFRAVIITALRLEYDAVRRQLADVQQVHHEQGTIYEVGDLVGATYPWEVALVLGGVGNVAAGIETERAIATFNPNIVVFVGVAGGLKDVQLGDVVVGTKVYGYEGGKAEAEFLPRPSVGEASYRLRHLAEAVQREGDWQRRIDEGVTSHEAVRVVLGPIVAGEKVVAATTSDVYSLLRKHYSDAIAAEMESAGFVHALHCNQPRESLIVRGISDLIDAKAHADASGWQDRAVAHAAAFATAVLAAFDPGMGLTQRIPLRMSVSDGRSTDSSGALSTRELTDESWNRLQSLMERLYPSGPSHEEIWRRAGGDLAFLGPAASGRAWWFDTLTRLRNGGGGTAITARTLLDAVRHDYPKDDEAGKLSAFIERD